MFSLLIVFCLLQLWLIFIVKSHFAQIRLSLVKAAIFIFVLIFFNTELLSYFKAVNFSGLTGLWIAENLGLAGVLFVQSRNQQSNFWPRLRETVVKNFREKLIPDKNYAVILLLIYAAVFFVAIFSVPNTSDSHTYHLARVANWIQWQNVDFYPTATLRQLYLGPLAEYGVLNILLLSGDDRLANLLQFGSLIGCGVTVSLIVREFKLNFSTQLLAMLLTASLPIAVLQASGTQTDLVVAFLTLGFFLFYLKASQTESGKFDKLLFGGLTAGLAVLAKGTAYIYCGAFGAVIFAGVIFSRLPRSKKTAFFAQSLLILLLAVSINSIQLTRNYRLFGSPISTGSDSVSNKKITPQSAVTGVVKNYVIHLGTFLNTHPAGLKRRRKRFSAMNWTIPTIIIWR
jgi:hypothetical protein